MKRLVPLAVLLLALPSPAAAAPPPPALPELVTWDDLPALVRAASPELAAAGAQAAVSRAELTEARRLPNPSVGYGTLHLLAGENTVDGTQHQLIVEQPLLIGGQRAARERLARARIAAAEREVALTFGDVLARARDALVALQAAEARLAAQSTTTEAVRHLLGVVTERATAGSASRYDVLRLTSELAQAEADLAELTAQRDAASAFLAATLGRADWAPRAPATLALAEVPTDPDALWARVQAGSPALEVARLREAAARRAIDVERREAWPTPAIALGPMVTTDPGSANLYAGLTLDVPLFDRNQAGLERARLELLAATATREALETALRAQVVAAARTLAARRRALDAFEREVLPDLPALDALSREAWRAGQSGVLDLLDTVRTRAELTQRHVDLRQAALAAELEALRVLGGADVHPDL